MVRKRKFDDSSSSSCSSSSTYNLIETLINDGGRFLFLHQLYNLLPNRMQVDNEIKELRDHGIIRLFHSINSANEIIIMKNSNYTDSFHDLVIKKCDENNPHLVIYKKFYQQILSHHKHSISILNDDLIKLYDNKDNIQLLVKTGYLIPRNDINILTYWFTHPAVPKFLNDIKKSRNLIIKTIKAAKFKEIAIKKIRLKSEKNNNIFPYDYKYHICDVIGKGIVQRFNMPDPNDEGLLRITPH